MAFFEKGYKKATIKLRNEAIVLGYGKYVITNEMTGGTGYQWITNSINKVKE